MAARPTDVRVTRRRRPGDQQREQKEATRQKLLDAAHIIFEEYSYTKASVDMIADEAGVSRTTFYRHFDGKLAIALAFFENLEREVQEMWRSLLDLPSPKFADAESWLARHVETVERDRVRMSVLREVDATETDAQPQVLRYYETVIAMMWGPQAAGRKFHATQLWGRSLLLLLQLDQFLYAICARNWNLSRGSLISGMAEQLHEFLKFRRQKLRAAR